MRKQDEQPPTPEQVADAIEQWMLTQTSTASARYLNRLERHQHCLLQARRMKNHRFQERLYSRWADALDLYETALFVAQNLGREFNASYHAEATAIGDIRFQVVNRLHANAVLTAGEIYQLLLGGFASGAYARWRSLHEIGVVIRFIEFQEPDTAEAFLLHREVRHTRKRKDTGSTRRGSGSSPSRMKSSRE